MQSGTVILRIVKLRFGLSHGGMMDVQSFDLSSVSDGASNADYMLQTVLARLEKTKEMAPNHYHTLKMR